jgi:hypothetical protein
MSTVSIYREMESSPTVILYGGGGDHEMILRDIDGWYGSPESKVQLSERAYGNGAHDIASEDIDYGARTVIVDWRIIANGRDGMLSALHAIRTLAGHTVRIRVVDGMDDLYAVGYVHEAGKDKSAQNIPQQTETGTLTIICQRPELLSTRASQVQLMPVSRVRGGLSYGPDGKGLSYGPDGRGLSYGVSAGGERNLAVLSNHGTTLAYPTLTVTGPFPAGVEIQTGVGGVIRYTGAVGMVPLVMQCDPRSMAASMGGVDVGRNLTGRDLPAIPAGGSMSLRLMSAGSGWVTITTRDAYL